MFDFGYQLNVQCDRGDGNDDNDPSLKRLTGVTVDRRTSSASHCLPETATPAP